MDIDRVLFFRTSRSIDRDKLRLGNVFQPELKYDINVHRVLEKMFFIMNNRFSVYYIRIKKGEVQGKYDTFSTMMHKEAGENLEMTTHHVSFRQMID